MIVHFLGQPSQVQFGALLVDHLKRAAVGEFSSIHMASAFAKNAGVARLKPAIEQAIGRRGNSITAYVGKDHDGTSREAVSLLYHLCTEVYVVHSTRLDVTYHPKVYLFEGSEHSSALIGSSNLTAGGLYTNLEAGIFFEDLQSTDSVLQELKTFLASISDVSQPHIQKISSANLSAILTAFPTEATISVARQASSGGAQPTQSGIPLFGPGNFPVAPPITGASTQAPTPASARTRTPASPRRAAGRPPISSISGFWKVLSPSDVAAGSSPGQIIIPKQFVPLFPQLGPARRMPSGARQADVSFAVRFHGLGGVRIVPDARLVLYPPAPHHPRPNIEHRFAFHDRSINPGGLTAGDILVYETLTNDPDNCRFNVYHVPTTDREYASIRALSNRRYAAL
jgi:HKD family nuclease